MSLTLQFKVTQEKKYVAELRSRSTTHFFSSALRRSCLEGSELSPYATLDGHVQPAVA
jgi:hypothetical protein